MISIGTFEELQRQNHTLALYCISCNRWGMANLDWLIDIGKGDKPVALYEIDYMWFQEDD